MEENHTSRLSRLTAILTLLLSKRLLTATEISKKFKISVRTVYRDMQALQEAGVPVITEEGKGYCIMEGYKLPPVMFTEKEAFALITSEQIILRNKDASLVKEFTEAISKIKSVLRHSSKQKSELLSDRIYIGKNFANQLTSRSLIDIQMALANYQLVKITYRASDGTLSERAIEPFSIYHNAEEEWTVIAYCRLRKDFRSFRLDRMTKVEITFDKFEPHKMTMKQYVEKYVSGRPHP